MSLSSLKRFESEFRRWVAAHDRVHGFDTDPDTLLTVLRSRIPDQYLSRIGSAYINGWLQTEVEPTRAYFVREADRFGKRGGQFTLIHRGDGTVAPCWELFVQLADYAWLRTIAKRHHQVVRLEDSLMDLTVRSGDRLILYVEQKTTAELAAALLEPLREYGRQGFSLNDADKGNDPLRKAKYLVRNEARPAYFGLSAVNFKKLFRVEYRDDNRFILHEEDRVFGHVLAENKSSAEAAVPSRSPIDDLAIEIERECPECWVSVGSGNTAYNFYVPGEAGDAIIIGISAEGRVWTDIRRLGPARSSHFSSGLSKLGIELPVQLEWAVWKRRGENIDVADLDPKVAEVVRDVLQARKAAGG